MRRVTALLFLVALWSALFAGEALAHGFGVRFDIPVPFWLYAYGAAAAVVFTFVLLVDERTAPHRYPRFDLMRLGWFRAAFASRAALFGLRRCKIAYRILAFRFHLAYCSQTSPAPTRKPPGQLERRRRNGAP